ncbi:type II toxin-antitoxin system RelE/ParE family toxin [Sorangium sp. So ce887]|uniref:type II toxin-antitoxin system RelE/ParE family toxin n=1 Tax=Sorangium sp. So ce887 TaxID=3133324 RepID=UPI003F61B9CC
MSRLLVRPSAELDIREAADWYEGEEDGLGGQFVDELRHIVRRISDLPSQFPDVGRGVRRALLKRSPHTVYFLLRVEGSERAAVILAVLHQRRSPSVWKKRVRDEGRTG